MLLSWNEREQKTYKFYLWVEDVNQNKALGQFFRTSTSRLFFFSKKIFFKLIVNEKFIIFLEKEETGKNNCD
jgi:hypothetical protein